jgi:hypothetical protein
MYTRQWRCKGRWVGARPAQVALEFEWMKDQSIETEQAGANQGLPFCQGTAFHDRTIKWRPRARSYWEVVASTPRYVT